MKQIPYPGPTIIRHHCRKYSHPSQLRVRDLCARALVILRACIFQIF